MSDIVSGAWHLRPHDGRPVDGGATKLAALLLAVLLLLAGAAALAGRALSQINLEAPKAAAPQYHAWLDIPKPVQIYSLQAPELNGVPLAYSARRRATSDQREDSLVFGNLGNDQPYLRLRLLREFASANAAPAAAVAAVPAASHARDVQGLATRFGRFHFEAIQLTRGATTMPCDRFSLDVPDPVLAIDGLACAGRSQSWGLAKLSCLIDRLDLASAGEDLPLVGFFALTELRRNRACAGMWLGPDGTHAAWLDDDAHDTPLRSLRRH